MATTNTNDTLTYEDFVENDVAIVIWIYISPILILFGTVGSITSIVVLATKKMRSPTTMFYLVLLSLTDILVLNTGLLRYWVKHAFGYDMRLSSSFSCKIHTVMVYLSLDYSSWILVLLTLDRCLSVCLPFSAMKFCTKRAAYVTSAVILCILFSINMHYIWTYDLIKGILFGTRFECYVAAPEFSVFLEDIWPWIDLCVVCGIPSIIMIVCNILIIRKLINSAHKMSVHTATGSIRVTGYEESQTFAPQPDATGVTRLTISFDKDKIPETVPSESTIFPNQTQPETESPMNTKRRQTTAIPKLTAKKKHISSLTVMLLSVNFVFLLLMMPISVYLLGLGEWRKSLTPHREAMMALAWAIVNMLQYTNNAIHFFLYYLTMPSFQRDLLSICRRTHKITPVGT